MSDKTIYKRTKIIVLLFLRLVVGYHFLFEGIDKLFNPHWSAASFLLHSNWLFTDFFHFIANNQSILTFVNLVNIWGQIFIGISLIIGLFSRASAIFGAVLILSYYVAIPPFVEGNTVFDKNLFEFFLFLILVLFPTSNLIGLDFLIEKYRSFNRG